MPAFLADENFNNAIIRELRKREPAMDIVRVQDTGLLAAPDPEVLAWAASEDRVVLTHDVSTMPRYAHDRIGRGESVTGVVIVLKDTPIGQVIEDLLYIHACGISKDFENRVLYLPL